MIEPESAQKLLGPTQSTLPHTPLTATMPGGLPSVESWQPAQASQQNPQPGAQPAQPSAQPAAPFDALRDLQMRIAQQGLGATGAPAQPAAPSQRAKAQPPPLHAAAFQAFELVSVELSAAAAEQVTEERLRAQLATMGDVHGLLAKMLRKEDPKGTLIVGDVVTGYAVLWRRTDFHLYRTALQILTQHAGQIKSPEAAILARSVALWSLLSAKLNEQLEQLMQYIETPAPNNRVILDNPNGGASVVLTPQQFALRKLNQNRLTSARRQIGVELLELAQDLAAQLHEERSGPDSLRGVTGAEAASTSDAADPQVTAAMLGE